MEFGGVVGMEGLVGSSSESGTGLFSSPLVSSDPESIRQKGFGSDFLKQGRTGEEPDWRCLKIARTESILLSPTKASSSLLRSNAHTLFPDGQQMLSFSSPRPDALMLGSDGTLPYYLPPSSLSAASASYVRNAGQGAGSLNMNMHGVLTGVRGPFTPSQWLELEHQALIYKYINANAPIPSNLLIPIRKSLNPSVFSGYSAASLRPSSLGWGSFHLGFSGNTDPEPGRCRRTDGKKWRCSRDAVADQKYCERHMNRGRHRSRKPVEGHSGHAVKVATPSPSASAVSGGGSSNNITIAQQQIRTSQSASTDPSSAQFNRSVLNKECVNDRLQDLQNLSMPTSMNTKPRDTLFPVPKQHNPFEDSSSATNFGIVSSDSLLNPARSFVSSPDLNEQEPQPHHPLRHFIDDWPKNHSDRSTISWELEEIQSDRTQLSISIPRASSDFSSSTSSPTQEKEKLTLSPLKLSRGFDPIHMGLGVGGVLNEASQRQASWIPISWETSMCGPLGEVLKNTNNTPREHSKNSSSSALNLMTGGWVSSPRLGSSPTGVLQKSTFGSLSSSTGSSPRTDNHRSHDSSSNLCDDLLGSTFMHSSSIPLCRPSA